MIARPAIACLSALLAVGCGTSSSPGGTAGSTGSAGTGNPGTAGTTGAAGATGTGGGSCAPLTSTVGISDVTGPAVGVGLVANSAVKKTLPITALSNDAMFTINGAWLIDPTSRHNLGGDPFAYTLVALTYHGSVPICSVQLNNFVHRDTAGNNVNATTLGIAAAGVAYVHAGTGMQCAALRQAVGECLAPGESGIAYIWYSFSGATLATTPIAKVDFASITGVTSLVDAQPDINVAATGYTVATTDVNSAQTLTATVKNTGTGMVQFNGTMSYFLLDEQGLPVYFGSMTSATAAGPLTAGQTTTISDTNVGFDASSTHVRFLPSFNRVLQ